MPRRFSVWSKVRYPDYPHLGEIQGFVEGVLGLKPLLVLLFGSVAKGDFTQHSDADVLVVFEKPMDWQEVYQHSRGMVQPLVKTLDEIVMQLREGEPFFIEVVEDGVPLYDADGVHARLLAEAKRAKAKHGLVRIEGGWSWRKENEVERTTPL